MTAIAVLVLNDHLLKSVAPGFITGKLSDIAGLAFFPLLLLGVLEIALSRLGRWDGPQRSHLIGAAAATGAVFAAVKVIPEANAAYEIGLGMIQAAPQILAAAVARRSIGDVARVSLVMDPSDLMMLPAVGIAYVIGLGRLRTTRGPVSARSPVSGRRVPSDRTSTTD